MYVCMHTCMHSILLLRSCIISSEFWNQSNMRSYIDSDVKVAVTFGFGCVAISGSGADCNWRQES